MLLIVLVSVSIVTALLARAVPRWDTALAWVTGATLAACAGLSTQGFDYQEYVTIIENTRQMAGQPLALQLVAAKDPIFLLIIRLAGAITDDLQLVFIIVAILAVGTKVLATAALPGRRTMYLSLYAVFIAPGLEFAAIRAALALGLVMVAYLVARRVAWRAWWVALGLASHLSVLFIVAGRLWPRWRRQMLAGLLVAGPLGLPWVMSFAADDARYFQYLSNTGTPLALVLPVSTLVTLMLLARSARGHLPAQHVVFSEDGLAATRFVVVTSVLLALPIVTASTRVMELAWVFMLAQMLARDLQLRGRLRMVQVASWCAMIGVFVLSNLTRGGWAILL